jgi:hypothetical protein
MEISKDDIKLYPNLVSQETLQTLTSYVKSLSEPELKAVHFKKDVEPSIQDIIEDVRNRSYKALTEDYLHNLGLKVKRVIFEEEGQIARYSQGINLPSHSDCPQWKFELPYFDLTTIMYVNDDYQGGEIYFEEFDYTYKPRSGELLIFPSYFLHETKVIKPLIGSTEYPQRASVPVFWSLEVEAL